MSSNASLPQGSSLPSFFSTLAPDFMNCGKTVDERIILVGKVFEQFKQLAQHDQDYVEQLPFPTANMTLADLREKLENSAHDSLCVQEVYQPVLMFVRFYVGKYVQTLDTVEEETLKMLEEDSLEESSVESTRKTLCTIVEMEEEENEEIL